MSVMFKTLSKKSWRNDAIWTHPIVFKSFLKYIALFFDTRALMKSQYWPRTTIRTLQEERLRSLLEAAPGVPFWKDVFDRSGVTSSMASFEALAKLPPVSKLTLAREPLSYTADQSLLTRADHDNTSGSTGVPFQFYFDWHAGLRSFAFTERAFRTATSGKRFPVVYLRARARNGFTPYKHYWFFLRGFHGVKNRIDQFRELAVRFKRGFILYGYSSSVLEVARQMEQNRIALPLKAVMATGESIGDSDRLFIERITGCEFFRVYASREAGYLAYECPLHTLHLSEEWAYFEVVDEEGKPLPAGKEGRILVTTFDNRIMPFIRYDLGDRGIIHDEPCPCGRTLRTITFRGRTAELIELEGGRVVSLLDICATIDKYWDGVRQFQLVQKSKREFVLKIVKGPRFEELKSDLGSALARLLDSRVDITWEFVETIPEAKSGKATNFMKNPS